MSVIPQIPTAPKPQATAPARPATHSMLITVRAESVREEKPGVFTLEIPGRELSEAEYKLIRGLFPHLEERAHELLRKEALIAAMEP